MRKIWTPLLLLAGVGFSTSSLATNDKLELKACHLKGIKSQVQCGTLSVPENYQQGQGKHIDINFAVIPAIDDSKKKAPLMFLAGGPGQASVELAAGLRRVFTEVRKTRDLILVDQRGTGQSNPLQCDDIDDKSVYEITPEDFDETQIRTCIDSLEGELSQYNSENAIRDFDEVRKALGHEKLSIYGGSYGTRAGLVYMRMFPQVLESVVLDSVGPIEVPIGLFGQSAARSFDLLVQHCQQEEECHKAYPNLAKEYAEVIARLEQAPVTLKIAHPRLGTQTDFVVSKSRFISTLRMQLYSVATRNMVPLIIHQAYLENYQPLAGLTAQMEDGMSMYVGLTFNIVCNEDFPKINADMFEQDANNNFGGGDSHSAFKKACAIWPQYSVDESFYQPVTADIPTLILSGDLDPVTPPSNGDFTDNTLPNSKHIVVKNASHTVVMSTCASTLVAEFLDSKDPESLDLSCLDKVPAESFMTGLNGSN